MVTSEDVATLVPQDGEVVKRRFEEGGSHDRVAAGLGWTRRKVRTLERDIQKGLRSWLKQRGFLER